MKYLTFTWKFTEISFYASNQFKPLTDWVGNPLSRVKMRRQLLQTLPITDTMPWVCMRTSQKKLWSSSSGFLNESPGMNIVNGHYTKMGVAVIYCSYEIIHVLWTYGQINWFFFLFNFKLQVILFEQCDFWFIFLAHLWWGKILQHFKVIVKI